jgi:hypothetical protein
VKDDSPGKNGGEQNADEKDQDNGKVAADSKDKASK